MIRRTRLILWCASFWLGAAAVASAATLLACGEATVQGGTNATTDIDELAAGYLHAKYSPSPFHTARKVYFQFDLAGAYADTNAPAVFTLAFANTFKQRAQLWALNQRCPAFGSNLTWNTAQANQTNSNSLLTSGAFTATPLGASVLLPTNAVAPGTYSFPLGRLGDYLFADTLTFVLAGVDDPSNSASGLRLQLGQAKLNFVTLTNVPRPSTNYDVYLLAGQSNMDGRGQAADLTNDLARWSQPQNDVRIYFANPGSSTNYDPLPAYVTGWQTLATGCSVPPGFVGALPSPDFGPEIGFGRTLADAQPSRHLALIKVSKGGTSLSSDWNPSRGYLYATFTNQVPAALADLTAEGHTYVVRGMIWHQGEADVSLGGPRYYTNLTAFIGAVRRDLGLANLPVVVGEIATNKDAAFRQWQCQVSQDVPWVGFASADGLETFEGTHFVSRDVLELGRRFALGFKPPPAQITRLASAGAVWTFDAGGLAGAPGVLLCSTNLSLPLTNWTAIASNKFDSLGRGQFTNQLSTGKRQQFFRLKVE